MNEASPIRKKAWFTDKTPRLMLAIRKTTTFTDNLVTTRQGTQSRIASHYSTVCVKCNPLSINPLRKLRAPRWRHALYISRYHSMNYIPRQMSRPEKSSPPDNKHKCPKIKSRPEGRLWMHIDFRLRSISTEEQPCKLSTFCYSHLCYPNSSYHRSRYLC